MFIDAAFPQLLGAELYRPHPSYIAEMCFSPLVVWDFSKAPGETIQLDRYAFWGEPGTKEQREREAAETIGTANARAITKKIVQVTLKEYSGPADPNDPSAPSTFKIPKLTILRAQRMLWDMGVAGFHQSIGSLNLLDDYRRWRDRVWINEALKSTNTYNPGGQADSTGYGSNTTAEVQGKFDIKRDLLTLVERLRTRNVPTFEDGNYRCLADPRFMKHLRQDPDFREVARYPGFPGMQPNLAIYGGGQYQQYNTPQGQPVMPSGFVFEGVRFFESTNMPTAIVPINFGSGYAAQTNEAHLGIFFGPQALGMGVGGPNAQVLLNNNDDFSRFVIAIWQLYAGFEPLNLDFVEVARTFAS
ncbi:hypothetical protein [Nodosilinea nodulosa]|uniref:hypothetical protein n=1 Tax=Nodosilinea nodulosa TaxID=416001 RepID=UPI00031D1B38|nr:hypothetical protein [Nodosilinea nodulosa]